MKLVVQIKKEMLEYIKRYKLVILFASVMFFSLLNPITLKLLPKILASQVDPALIESMNIDMKGAVVASFEDMINTVVMILVFMSPGIISREFQEGYSIVPFTKGLDKSLIPVAKGVVYTLFSFVVTIVAVLVTYYYSDMLFEEGKLAFGTTFKFGMMIAAIYLYVWNLYIMLDVLIFRKFLPSVATIIFIFVTAGVYRWFPDWMQVLFPANLSSIILSFGMGHDNIGISVLAMIAMGLVFMTISALLVRKRTFE